MTGAKNGPSIRMVATAAGVSVATVSNVVNGKSSVASDIARRVQAAIAELGYVRDHRAARLRSGTSRLVGVVVPDLTNPMFAAFVSTLEHLARGDGYDIVVVSTRNQAAEEAERLRHIRGWRPAGLVVIPCDGALDARLAEDEAPPLVVVDRIPDTSRFDLVAVDNAAASGQVVRHLAERGCVSCLVVGTSLEISNVRERWEGAMSAGCGIALDLIEVGLVDYAPPALVERLRGAERPDALFCLTHEATLAAYRLLGEMGIAVGRDIAFASFDEMEWMRLVSPPVTAVRQPVEEMAECAWRKLARLMARESGAATTRRLRCAVNIRGSTTLWAATSVAAKKSE
jgi:DNA-binding LacI/PurR family transcriptional regulator